MFLAVLGRPCCNEVVLSFRNGLATLLQFVVCVLRARSFLRLRLPDSACSIRVLTSLETAFLLWLFVLSFAHFLFVFVWSFEVVLSESADFAFRLSHGRFCGGVCPVP